MKTKKENKTEQIRTRIVFSAGGKGGTGKTSVVTALGDWYKANEIPLAMIDFDVENKVRGSLSHYFKEATKINPFTPSGLDSFIDYLDQGVPIVLVDMGAGSGRVTYEWFNLMHETIKEMGVAFTALGVVTSDPASVESVLTWGAELQEKVDYLIVENSHSEHSEFTYWQKAEQAEKFRSVFNPAVMKMGFRIPDLENHCRNYGVTLNQVATRAVDAPELKKTSLVVRAQAYRRALFSEFDRSEVKERLLP